MLRRCGCAKRLYGYFLAVLMHGTIGRERTKLRQQGNSRVIHTFIDRHNRNPKPLKWIKSADQILASVKRFCQKTQQTLCGEL